LKKTVSLIRPPAIEPTLTIPLRWKIVVDVHHNLAIFLSRTYLRHMLISFEFCIPTQGIAVPAGPDWYHEIE
jgi:hypothetical protein